MFYKLSTYVIYTCTALNHCNIAAGKAVPIMSRADFFKRRMPLSKDQQEVLWQVLESSGVCLIRAWPPLDQSQNSELFIPSLVNALKAGSFTE